MASGSGSVTVAPTATAAAASKIKHTRELWDIVFVRPDAKPEDYKKYAPDGDGNKS